MPSGVNATPPGLVPTVIVAAMAPVATVITLTVPAPVLVT